jgi:glycosyltransferase involved in cell wall biosynthesis
VAFNRLVLRHSDRVTAVGDFVKDALVRNEGIADRRVQVIHNGIDPARFARDTMAAQRVAVRAELGLDPHQPVLLQVARFHPIKDHDTSICALARVLSHAPQTVLLLAGDGPTRANAEALAAQLGVADQVRFLGVRTDVPSLTAAADLFVLSSLCEGISVTLLEAMAAGLPIVATDAGGNGELVEHGHNGWLARTGSAASLADHLLSLLRDPDLRRRFGERGRRRLLKRFTEKRMHSQYERLYEQMLSAA